MAAIDNNIQNRIPLNIVLIGKTGHGKSATGNSILNRDEFDTSPEATAVNVDVMDSCVVIGSNLIKVVDVPGLENPDLSKGGNIEKACENIAEALRRCKKGIHVFVLVLKFGVRFTQEEQKTITTWKDILGENYFKERVIILLTCGDQLTPPTNFEEWRQAQKGHIKTLFTECGGRVVLFNNVTATEEQKQTQRNKLLLEVKRISSEKGLYKDTHFQENAPLRKKLIQKKLTMYNESVQRKTDLLTVGLGCLTVTSSVQDVEHVEKQANDLRQEITDQGVDKSVQEKIRILESLAINLQELKQGKKKENVIEKLQKQKNELEECRGSPQDNPLYEFALFSLGLGLAITGGLCFKCYRML